MDQERITTEALAAIEALAEAATPGPWEAQEVPYDGYEPMTDRRLTPQERAEIRNRAERLSISARNYSVSYEQCVTEDVPAILADLDAADAENASLRTQLEAAKRDLHDISDVYKFCDMCKYHRGDGADTCTHPERFSCDAENFYDWRGVCPDNAPPANWCGEEAVGARQQDRLRHVGVVGHGERADRGRA